MQNAFCRQTKQTNKTSGSTQLPLNLVSPVTSGHRSFFENSTTKMVSPHVVTKFKNLRGWPFYNSVCNRFKTCVVWDGLLMLLSSDSVEIEKLQKKQTSLCTYNLPPREKKTKGSWSQQSHWDPALQDMSS